MTGAVFFSTAISLLGGIGVLQSTSLEHGLGFLRTFAVLLFLYVVSATTLSRRYR
jgi:type III secretory pathway component EscS